MPPPAQRLRLQKKVESDDDDETPSLSSMSSMSDSDHAPPPPKTSARLNPAATKTTPNTTASIAKARPGATAKPTTSSPTPSGQTRGGENESGPRGIAQPPSQGIARRSLGSTASRPSDILRSQQTGSIEATFSEDGSQKLSVASGQGRGFPNRGSGSDGRGMRDGSSKSLGPLLREADSNLSKSIESSGNSRDGMSYKKSIDRPFGGTKASVFNRSRDLSSDASFDDTEPEEETTRRSTDSSHSDDDDDGYGNERDDEQPKESGPYGFMIRQIRNSQMEKWQDLKALPVENKFILDDADVAFEMERVRLAAYNDMQTLLDIVSDLWEKTFTKANDLDRLQAENEDLEHQLAQYETTIKNLEQKISSNAADWQNKFKVALEELDETERILASKEEDKIARLEEEDELETEKKADNVYEDYLENLQELQRLKEEKADLKRALAKATAEMATLTENLQELESVSEKFGQLQAKHAQTANQLVQSEKLSSIRMLAVEDLEERNLALQGMLTERQKEIDELTSFLNNQRGEEELDNDEMAGSMGASLLNELLVQDNPIVPMPESLPPIAEDREFSVVTVKPILISSRRKISTQKGRSVQIRPIPVKMSITSINKNCRINIKPKAMVNAIVETERAPMTIFANALLQTDPPAVKDMINARAQTEPPPSMVSAMVQTDALPVQEVYIQPPAKKVGDVALQTDPLPVQEVYLPPPAKEVGNASVQTLTPDVKAVVDSVTQTIGEVKKVEVQQVGNQIHIHLHQHAHSHDHSHTHNHDHYHADPRSSEMTTEHDGPRTPVRKAVMPSRIRLGHDARIDAKEKRSNHHGRLQVLGETKLRPARYVTEQDSRQSAGGKVPLFVNTALVDEDRRSTCTAYATTKVKARRTGQDDTTPRQNNMATVFMDHMQEMRSTTQLEASA